MKTVHECTYALESGAFVTVETSSRPPADHERSFGSVPGWLVSVLPKRVTS